MDELPNDENATFSNFSNVMVVGSSGNSLNFSSNSTWGNYTDFSLQDEYIFDRTDIRIIFITLYTIVFCCCFFGNLLVILVVTLSRRLRSITNFFLANLAVADLCVGVFCVFQNLSMYLIPTLTIHLKFAMTASCHIGLVALDAVETPRKDCELITETDRCCHGNMPWVLGDFLCKMYQFVHSLSYTASIFILVVICTERYFAIIHPITCKQILTPTRLRLVIGAVWVTSAVYSAPRFLWVQTIVTPLRDGGSETICATHRQRYNSKLFDMINFVFLYVIPLAVMTVLYTRIAVGLWRSSRQLEKHLNASMSSVPPPSPSPCEYTHACMYQPPPDTPTQPGKLLPLSRSPSTRSKHQVGNNVKFSMECKPNVVTGGAMSFQHPSSSQNVLRARRGVIRMLIVVVLTFALCNLPFHARKMWQYWSSGYSGSSDFSTLFTPLTFLITYFNSGVNPLLYAFLSRNFRRGMREILLCSFRGSTRYTQNHKLYNIAPTGREGGMSLLQRQASTRSTLKANTTTVTIINNANSDDYSQEV